jgi:hypothetical protein
MLLYIVGINKKLLSLYRHAFIEQLKQNWSPVAT